MIDPDIFYRKLSSLLIGRDAEREIKLIMKWFDGEIIKSNKNIASQILKAGEINCMTSSNPSGEMIAECKKVINRTKI